MPKFCEIKKFSIIKGEVNSLKVNSNSVRFQNELEDQNYPMKVKKAFWEKMRAKPREKARQRQVAGAQQQLSRTPHRAHGSGAIGKREETNLSINGLLVTSPRIVVVGELFTKQGHSRQAWLTPAQRTVGRAVLSASRDHRRSRKQAPGCRSHRWGNRHKEVKKHIQTSKSSDRTESQDILSPFRNEWLSPPLEVRNCLEFLRRLFGNPL